MNNIKVALDAISKLSESDKAKLGKIILENKSEYEKDPVAVVIESLKKLEFDYTDERNKEFLEQLLMKKQNELPYYIDLFLNDDYIKWLITFVTEKGFLDTDTFEYSYRDLSDEEKQKIYNLQLFYKGIDEYARNNNIDYSTNEGYSCWYHLKYNDAVVRVSVFIHGSGFTASLQDLRDVQDNYIEFNEIMNSYIELQKGFSRKKTDN